MNITPYRAAICAIVPLVLFSLWIPAGTIEHWNFLWHGFPVRVAYLVFLCLSAFCGYIALIGARQRPLPVEYGLAGIVFVWLLSSLTSIDRAASFRADVGLLSKGVVAGWAVFRLVRSRDQALWIARFLFLVITLAAFVGLLEFARGGAPFFPHVYYDSGRIVGTVGHALPFAAVVVVGMALCVESFSENYAFTIGMATLLSAVLILTFSRSSWAIAALMALYLAFSDKGWRQKIMGTLITTMILCALLETGLLVQGNRERMTNIRISISNRFKFHRARTQTEGNQDLRVGSWILPTNSHRIASYMTSWRMVKKRPMLGLGPGTFPLAYDVYMAPGSAPEIPSPDSMVLRLMAETGLLGLGAWVGFMVVWLRVGLARIRTAPSEEKPFRKALMLSALTLWANGLFFDCLNWAATLMTLSIVTALSAGDWSSDEPVPKQPS